MSWNPFPPDGLEMVFGTDSSQNLRYLHPEETKFCPGDSFNPDATIPWAIINGVALIGVDSYAADHVSALAAYELVQIYTLGGGSGGSQGGWPALNPCVSYRNGDPPDPSSYTGVDIDLGGLTTELRLSDDGTLLPILNPVQDNFAPISAGLLMRPTALTWPGQDPTNDANRSVWLPSEVIGVLGAVTLYHTIGGASGYDVFFGTGVRALNVISGVPGEIATEEPVICFV